MALQNIGAGNKDDAFYRYKMPRMITKIEGRGNGIKTNVVNMVDIAKALGRPAAYTTKYFGCELGAQSKFDEKTGASHVNGSHDTGKLAGLLEIFIKKYVQCYGCGNPETEIIITKAQMINLKCAACGFLSDVDMRDKLTTFIIKNPPEQKKGSKDKKAMRRAEKERLKEGEAADEEMKKLKKDTPKKKGSSGDVATPKKKGSGSSKDLPLKASSKKRSQGSDEDHSPTDSLVDENESVAVVIDDDDDGDDNDGDDVQWLTDTSAEAARQRIQEQLSAVTAGMVMLTTNESKDSPRGGEKKSRANGHANGVNPSNSPVNLVDDIKEYLKKGPSAGELKSFLGSLSGTSRETILALFEVLFGGLGKGFAKEVSKKMAYLAAVTREEEGSGSGSGLQVDLLNAIETFCGKASPEAVKELGLVLKALYDNDVLEEESIVAWYGKGSSLKSSSSQIWKNVKPFVEWLQSAESETEEEGP